MPSVDDFMRRLKRNEQRGSKPRCHWLTHGSEEEMAKRLSRLIEPWGRVDPKAVCLPRGFEVLTEAQLHRKTGLLSASTPAVLKAWWLGTASDTRRTPHWDIATTCVIGDREDGVLLVEAKAHSVELIKERAGRKVEAPVTNDAQRTHVRIGEAIQEANAALTKETGVPWALVRDRNYQMSNRFAWAWKLAELGTPVILVYLGFLHADEMVDKSPAFQNHAEWQALVRAESEDLFPFEVWNRAWNIQGVPLIPLIKSTEQPFDRA